LIGHEVWDDTGIWDAWVVLSSGNGVKSLMKGEGVPWILHMETGYNYNLKVAR